MGHPPRIPVWLGLEQSVIYFVTICVQNRQPVLANIQTLEALKIVTARFRDWKILAAMIMPDHVHVITTPTQGRDAHLGNFSAALKRWMREELRAEWKWQGGCFDRLLRSEESLHVKWLYLLENPVRAGLVSDADDWPYRIGIEP
jgi:putative transposase